MLKPGLEVVLAAALTALLAALFCGIYLRIARRRALLAIPGERSSHRLPTPHGGGVALLTAFLVGLAAAYATRGTCPPDLLGIALGTLLLLLLGLCDDLRGLPVSWRLLAYSLICLTASLWLLRDVLPSMGLYAPAVALLASLALLWLVNLYNFMDGIDGLAALQMVLTCGAAALLSRSGPGGDFGLFCLLLGAAYLGFLCWNWPPARLFMGDAGSIPGGFLLGALALSAALRGELGLAVWAILLAPFVVDASWTLLWRLASGQRLTRPHRMHAYQRLSRHWNSHLGPDLLLISLHGLWLIPLALAAVTWPRWELVLVILAYLPLLYGMAQVPRIK